MSRLTACPLPRHHLLLAGLAAAAALAAAPAGLASEPLMLPRGEGPASLAALGDLTGARAVAVSSDGMRAAMGVTSPRRADRSLVRVVTDPVRGARAIEVRGEVLGLAFDGYASDLYVLLHRPERRGPGQAFLARIDIEAARVAREVGVPSSARGLAVWETEQRLLVACQDELRTFSTDDLASGRLFLLPGENRAITWLPGGDQVLVGQRDRLLLVDLGDPQTREGLSPREGVEVPAAFDQLAAAPDGAGAVARGEDGSAWEIALDPLTVRPAGTALAVLWPGTADPGALRRPPPRPELREPPPPEPPQIERPQVPEPIPPPPPPPRAVPQPIPPVVTPEPRPPSPGPRPSEPPPEVPEPEPSPEPEPVPEPAPPLPPAPDVRPEARPPDARVWGRITGPAAREVVAVLILGPDSILREAARVAPDADGIWSVSDLPPGTYRIQVDGGGKRALVSSPPFRILKLAGDEERATVPDIEVLRAL